MQKALRLFVIVLFLVITVAAASTKPGKVVNSGVAPAPMCPDGNCWPMAR